MVGFEYLSECAAWSYLFANGTPSAEGMTVSSVCEQGCDNKTRLAAEPADTPDVGGYAARGWVGSQVLQMQWETSLRPYNVGVGEQY
jgi:hypothetical protein